MDCSPPGSSVHGSFQARVLEWGAVAFSAEPLSDPHKLAPLGSNEHPPGPTPSPGGTVPPVSRGVPMTHPPSRGLCSSITASGHQVYPEQPLLSALHPFLPQSRASPGGVLGLSVSPGNPPSAATAVCSCWGPVGLPLQKTVLTPAALSNKWPFFQSPQIPKW